MTPTTHSQIEAAVKRLMGHIEKACLIKDGEQPELEQLIVDLIQTSSAELTRPQAAPSSSEAADARREIGKWLNEGTNKPVDREALAQLCTGFDALARPQEVATPVTDEQIEQAARYEFNGGLDWTNEGNLLASAVQRAYFRFGAKWALAASRAQEVVRAEPVAYQARTRATWRNLGEGWTEWESCSAESYADYNKKPILHDWQYETRALYTAPPSTAPLSEQPGGVIAAAEKFAANYDGDDRVDIKTDVLNAFYAGSKFAAQPKDPAPGPVAVGEAFKRERRYVVFKVSDIKRVPAAKAKQIYDLARWFDERRMEEHRSPMTCVVVEHDWPEYEPTWAAIQQRMEKSK